VAIYLTLHNLIIFLFTINCFLPLLAHAQSGTQLSRFHIEHYTGENGLPQNSVYSIVQDELGFMWLSTERGLVRYDGNEFTIFDDFGGTYASSSIGNIGIDPRPNSKGIYAVNGDHRFIRIHQGVASADTVLTAALSGLPFPYPTKHKGHLLERLPKLDDEPGQVPYVAPIGNGRYFVYDLKVLRYFENNRLAGQQSLPGMHPWGFFRVGSSLYHWENGRLIRFHASSKQFMRAPATFKGALVKNRSFQAPCAFQIFWNNAVNQIFVRVNQSLYVLTPDAQGNLDSRLILEGFDFSKDIVRSVYYDQKADRIFLGTHVNGLFVLTRKKFLTLATPFPDTDQVYYGQASIGKRGVLSSQGIIYQIDPASGNTAAHQLPLVTKSINWDKTSIAIDADGDIWCKNRKRLMVISADAKKMRASWDLPAGITQLYHGPDGTIWIGTEGAGIFQIKAPLKEGSTPARFDIGPLSGISWIQESGGYLWIAMVDGLVRVERANRKILRIKDMDGIYVRSLHISPDGSQVWITTYKSGLYLLKDLKLTHFPLDPKGDLANTHCIVEDRNGFFWVPTNNGLFQMLKSDLLSYARRGGELYYHHYSKADGFNSNEFNGRCEPCAVRLGSGHISLPSMNGLVWFKPENTVPELPDKPMVVNSIAIDRHSLPASSQQQVTFSQKAKELRIEVLTPFFGNPQNLRFYYALQQKGSNPSEAVWLPVDAASGNKAVITISTLSKGDYMLFVRKMDGFVQKNQSYKTVEISVPPFWYQTWWFYTLAAAFILLVGVQYIRYRINRVRRINLALERQVSARTAQLRGTLRDLEKSQENVLSQMHLQSRLMASIAHDVRSPLGAAITVASEMQKMISKGQYEKASLVGKNIEDAMRQVKASLEEMLTYVKIRIYQHEPQTEVVDLNLLIEENIQLYGKNTRINANTFINQIPSDTLVMTNGPLLKIIVHNLIDNANKFTTNGIIQAYVSKEGDLLRLYIEDSGRGIPQKLLDWFENKKAITSEAPHTGIGLVMVKELAANVVEDIRIEPLNPGTRVVLTFRWQALQSGKALVTGAVVP
jgi:signal transduction histidine kinase